MGGQLKKTSYAQHAQVKAIRAQMVKIMQREVSGSDLREVVMKLIPDSIAKDIEKACHSTYPLQDVYTRKVKILKKPKLDLSRLMKCTVKVHLVLSLRPELLVMPVSRLNVQVVNTNPQ